MFKFVSTKNFSVMKSIFFFFFISIALGQNPNHDILFNNDWRLNFVQIGTSEPVYVDEGTYYPLMFSNESNNYSFVLSVCNWHHFDYNYVENQNQFNITGGASSLIMCTGDFYPANIEVFDSFPNLYYPNFDVNNYPFTVTQLSENQYSLDIYSPANDRMNFRNSNLSTTIFTNNKVQVYPNPSSDKVIISSIDKVNSIFIYNNNGQKVIETSNKEINVSNLSSGIYVLKVFDVNNVATIIKLVKQ